MPLVEMSKGCFDSLQAKQCTEKGVTGGRWFSEGPARLSGRPPQPAQHGKQSPSLGGPGALGSPGVAGLRKAWQQAGPSRRTGNQN